VQPHYYLLPLQLLGAVVSSGSVLTAPDVSPLQLLGAVVSSGSVLTAPDVSPFQLLAGVHPVETEIAPVKRPAIPRVASIFLISCISIFTSFASVCCKYSNTE